MNLSTRNTGFFPTRVRVLLSDFSVIIAIVTFVLIDWSISLPTPKLEVPFKFEVRIGFVQSTIVYLWEGIPVHHSLSNVFIFELLSRQPTNAEERDWVINPFKNANWAIAAAVIPAMLATILIFMDQQITAVIVNRREHLLKKGIVKISIQ